QIAGICVSGVSGVIIILLALWLCRRYRKPRSGRMELQPLPNNKPEEGNPRESQSSHSVTDKGSFIGNLLILPEKAIHVIRFLGGGHNGDAHLARLDGKEVVIKVPKSNKEDSYMKIFSELGTNLRYSKGSKFICEMIGAIEFQSRLCIVLKYYRNGSLDKLHETLDMHLEPLFSRIVHDVCEGLKYLHSHNVGHRDIACRNLFMDENHNVVLGDLGLATTLQDGRKHKTKELAWAWLAPEALRCKYHVFTAKTDIWALGVTCYELLTRGRSPYNYEYKLKKPEKEELKRKIVDNEVSLEIPTKACNIGKIICKLCLDREPSRRPDAKGLLKILEEKHTYDPTEGKRERVDVKKESFDSKDHHSEGIISEVKTAFLDSNTSIYDSRMSDAKTRYFDSKMSHQEAPRSGSS
ncbi:hypothetical protein AAMO2058_000749400, partial [Amorphochlora amoebiformis]